MQILHDTNVNFVGVRRWFFIASGILALLAIVAIAVRGFNWGVDFTGGSLLHVRFSQPISTEAVRGALTAVGEGEAVVQRDEHGDFFIRAKVKESAGGQSFSSALTRQLKASFPNNSFEILSDDTVGPQVSSELRGKVLLAVLLGLVGIMIYVSFRFDFRFGTGAVLSLIHDTLIVVGAIALFGREMNMTVIAAVLTMIGYSVNDSIVVSDRIREDVRKMRKESFSYVANHAINKTLSRTIITSLTVLFVSLALLIFGSATIKDFAFAMTLGTITGTYSSVFVVANLVVEWENWSPSKRRR
ncbi:MAG TPA: protein translocase subunit SecF [bacterium]|nr:protein translocase subunit SecF [bacterium]